MLDVGSRTVNSQLRGKRRRKETEEEEEDQLKPFLEICKSKAEKERWEGGVTDCRAPCPPLLMVHQHERGPPPSPSPPPRLWLPALVP